MTVGIVYVYMSENFMYNWIIMLCYRCRIGLVQCIKIEDTWVGYVIFTSVDSYWEIVLKLSQGSLVHAYGSSEIQWMVVT